MKLYHHLVLASISLIGVAPVLSIQEVVSSLRSSATAKTASTEELNDVLGGDHGLPPQEEVEDLVMRKDTLGRTNQEGGAGAGSGHNRRNLQEEEEEGLEVKDDDDDTYQIITEFNGTMDETFKFPVTPDPTVAAGIEAVIGMTMLDISIRTKEGDVLAVHTLHEFFQPINETLSLDDYDRIDFQDPKVIFDMMEERFIAMALLSNDANYSYIVFAISNTSDPALLADGHWQYSVMDVFDQDVVSNEPLKAVFPDIVVDGTAAYITSGMHLVGSGVYMESRLWIMDKIRLYTTTNDEQQFNPLLVLDGKLELSNEIFGGPDDILKSVTRYEGGPFVLAYVSSFSDLGKKDVNFGTYLVSYHSTNETEFAYGFKITNPLDISLSVEMFNVTLGDVELYDLPLPLAKQLQAPIFPRIDTHERRAVDAVWFNESLWFVVPVRVEDDLMGPRTAVYWAKILAPSDTSVPMDEMTLLNSGYVTGQDFHTGVSTFNPSIAINQFDIVAIGFSMTGPGLPPGAYVTIRDDTMDGPGVTQMPQTVKAGDNRYVSLDGLGHYAEYSGVSLDPEFEECFWLFNEYATFLENVTVTWATYYAAMCLPGSGILNRAGNGTTSTPTLSSAPTPVTTSSPTGPTGLPSLVPTMMPTAGVSSNPTGPTGLPSLVPTMMPTAGVSSSPTGPTDPPNSLGTAFPSSNPSASPSGLATTSTTEFASASPSEFPSQSPSRATPEETDPPTVSPTGESTQSLTPPPTPGQTTLPSPGPSTSPTTPLPTQSPTSSPTETPSETPSQSPTTKSPTQSPTETPSESPSQSPTTKSPTQSPTETPSESPSQSPTTKSPTESPKTRPPTSSPSTSPSSVPTPPPTPRPVGRPPEPTNPPDGLCPENYVPEISKLDEIPGEVYVAFPDFAIPNPLEPIDQCFPVDDFCVAGFQCCSCCCILNTGNPANSKCGDGSRQCEGWP